MGKDQQVQTLKEELVACVAVARQVGGHIPGVQQVITEIENCAATADTTDCVKELLTGMQKPALKLVSASTKCGNLPHKVTRPPKGNFRQLRREHPCDVKCIWKIEQGYGCCR